MSNNPSKIYQAIGTTLINAATEFGLSQQTLINWSKQRPQLSEVLSRGLAMKILDPLAFRDFENKFDEGFKPMSPSLIFHEFGFTMKGAASDLGLSQQTLINWVSPRNPDRTLVIKFALFALQYGQSR